MVVDSMKIRPYKIADLDGLSELYLKTRIANWHWMDASKWTLRNFEEHTQNEFILVVVEGERYMGFASIYMEENFLHHLFIASEDQNKGIGLVLLKAVENLFTGTGYLKCLTENKSALSFYLKNGWSIESQGQSDEGDYFLMSKEKSEIQAV